MEEPGSVRSVPGFHVRPPSAPMPENVLVSDARGSNIQMQRAARHKMSYPERISDVNLQPWIRISC